MIVITKKQLKRYIDNAVKHHVNKLINDIVPTGINIKKAQIAADHLSKLTNHWSGSVPNLNSNADKIKSLLYGFGSDKFSPLSIIHLLNKEKKMIASSYGKEVDKRFGYKLIEKIKKALTNKL